MKVGLIDVDNMGKTPSFPSLPLMKISAYHKARGDQVDWWFPLSDRYDLVYQSKVFTFTPDLQYPVHADRKIMGGTGYGLNNFLIGEIEHAMPDYGLYGNQFADTAFGFLTRGCPRGCPFCIVSAKEGRESRQVADLSEFWNGQRNVKLLDPNLLACSRRETLLRRLEKSGAWVDFTQGLDIRLMDREAVRLLSALKIRQIHFAWDDPKQDLSGAFRQFKVWSGIKDYRKLGVYVLTNYNSTQEEDLMRVYALRDLGYSPYVMVYDKEHAPIAVRRLQRWCNNRIIFAACRLFENYNDLGDRRQCMKQLNG